MRSLPGWAFLAVAGCTSHQTLTPASPPSNVAAPEVESHSVLAGTYRNAHEIRVVCDTGSDGWCGEQAEDTLRISDAPDNALSVAIELIQTNGHTCTFEGLLAPVPVVRAGVQQWSFHGEDAEGSCALVLEHTSHELRISADGCRYYCGVRASLDATFPVWPSKP